MITIVTPHINLNRAKGMARLILVDLALALASPNMHETHPHKAHPFAFVIFQLELSSWNGSCFGLKGTAHVGYLDRVHYCLQKKKERPPSGARALLEPWPGSWT